MNRETNISNIPIPISIKALLRERELSFLWIQLQPL